MQCNRSLGVTVAGLIVLMSHLPAGVAGAQVTAGKPVAKSAPKPAVAAAAAAGAGLAFESNLKVGALASPYVGAPLSWSAYPGATTYHVLRYPSATSAPVSVATMPQTQYMAHVIPGFPFVFRIVAYNAAGTALDTTKAASFSTPGAPSPPLLSATCASIPSSIALNWSAVSRVDDYRVSFWPVLQRTQHGGDIMETVSLDTAVTTTAFTPATFQPGEFGFNVQVRAEYTLHDYPAAGQATHITAAYVEFGGVMPFTKSGPCINNGGSVAAAQAPSAGEHPVNQR